MIVVDPQILVSIENAIDKTLSMISKEIKVDVVDSLIFVSNENVIDKTLGMISKEIKLMLLTL